jgi:anti-anti-sigma factor
VPSFEAEVVERAGETVVLLRGELDLAGVATVHRAMATVASSVARADLVLDCRRLSFVDSTGLLALLRATRRLSGPGRPTLRSPGRLLVRLLDLSALGDEFSVVVPPAPVGGRRRRHARRSFSAVAATAGAPSTPRRRRRPTARRR